MSVRTRLATLAVATVCATGCDSIGPGSDAMDELERNQSLWERVGPATYRYAVERLCFCGVEARGPVRVAVADGQVLSRVYADSGDPVSPPLEDLFPTVDGLFDILRDAIERGAHSIDVTYDPETGVPIDLWIDYEDFVADEELGFGVTEAVSQILPD